MMEPAAGDRLFGVGLGGLAIALGLLAIWLGRTEFGRIVRRPRPFWGMLGVGFVLVGLGFVLMGLEDGAPYPPPEDVTAVLVRSAGFYVLLGGVLVIGLWAPWAYLQQYLYTTKETVVAGTFHIEHHPSRRLRRRHLAAAAAGVGASTGLVTAGTLVSFSRTAPQGDPLPILAAIGVGCVVWGVAFAVTFLGSSLWFRGNLLPD
jgi:hypothetical protein